MSTTENLLTAGALARRLDMSAPRMTQLLRQGAIQPDFRAGKMFLFRADRLSEITQSLKTKNQ